MAKKFVVVDTGCIECGESTEVLGIYRTRKAAEEEHKEGDYFDGGQHCIEIFEVEV